MKVTSIFISILQQSSDEWWRIHRSNYTGYFSQKKKLYKKKDKICWNISSGFSWICPPGIFSGFFPRIFGLNIFPEFSFVADFFLFVFREKMPSVFQCSSFELCLIFITGIPRLTRFSIARFPIARIFEVVQENLHSTVLYLKIYSVMQIFLTFFQVILWLA